ncbi:stress enhanced protein 1, chloroplastic isoform X2 [Telopea speciosissima]|uniref:stress enhanced protein 1, chloroplastic isoform X2 n=1 Tax=Telopea speciosissima TaxID=54955 RepID=UPI001CC3F59D|nr:stress enhanced protein 1, chloroplastic isoform X2 [Telopea speciosissima]
MAQAQVSASLCLSLRDVRAVHPLNAGVLPRLPLANIARTGTSFARGSPLLSRTLNQIKPACKAASISIRCEQGTKGSGGLDVWLGRFAMIGFAVAITVEIVTGKGLLENFGLTSPLPTLALAVTAVVGILTAVFIIQSASED